MLVSANARHIVIQMLPDRHSHFITLGDHLSSFWPKSRRFRPAFAQI